MPGGNEKVNERVHLNELWERLDSACRKLWQEDRVSAIPLQAVAEEIKAEFRGTEQLLESMKKALQDQKKLISQDYELQYGDRIVSLEKELQHYKSHSAALEEQLAKEKSHVESLLKDVESKEEENVQFREKYLKIEAERDAVRAKKMEEFHREMETKADDIERMWEERKKALESESKHRKDEPEKKYQALLEAVRLRAEETETQYLQKEAKLLEAQKQIQAELQARDERLHAVEEALRKQTDAANARAAELEREYAQKRTELDGLKQRMQAEMGEVLKRYQAKTAG